ncbi:MAG: hypothetical protein PHW02_00995 [bacterium]|nr:hypothetical protein [bacterium]
MKKVFLIFILLLTVVFYAEDWQIIKILDIGIGERFVSGNSILTGIGVFENGPGNSSLISFNGNMKSISSSSNKFLTLDHDDILSIYYHSYDTVELLYSLGPISGAKKASLYDSLILVQAENNCKIFSADSESLRAITGFNESNILSIASSEGNVVILKNQGEVISAGLIAGGRYIHCNSLETDDASILFKNKFNAFVSNSDRKELLFYTIVNDSLIKANSKITDHKFIKAFTIDTLFGLATSDSIFIVQFNDTFNFSFIDSMGFTDTPNDIVVKGDSLFVLSESKVISKKFHSPQTNESGYSHGFLGSLSSDSKYFLFSSDSVFFYDSTLSLSFEKKGFLFQKDLYSVYEDSTILILDNDSLLLLKSSFIPSAAAISGDSFLISSRDGEIASCDLSGLNFKVNFKGVYPAYDLCLVNDKMGTASGFYGFNEYDSAFNSTQRYKINEFINESKSFGEKLYLGIGNTCAVKENDETLFCGDFVTLKNEDKHLLLFCGDSIMKIDSTQNWIAPQQKKYSGIVNGSIIDTSAVVLLEGRATVLMSKTLTFKREEEQKSIIAVNKKIEPDGYTDLSGRKVGTDKLRLKNGIYFIYDHQAGKVKKHLIIK